MEGKTVYSVINLVMVCTLFLSLSCKKGNGTGPELSENLESVDEVNLISGAEDVTITVNKSKQAYFSIGFSGIKLNDIIENGVGEGWCIDWLKRINSNNNTYSGIKLYSTDQVEKWKTVNYLLNIKDKLMAQDSDLSFREIQVAIWSLRANPEFDLDNIAVEDLPADMRTNGEPKFSFEKVREILSIVQSGYKEFNFSAGTQFAVIVATPENVQTVITVVEKK